MKRGNLQCKDIPTRPILDLVAKVERKETFWYPDEAMKPAWGSRVAHSSATWFWSDFRPENSLGNAMPEGVSGKMVLAKAKQLIRSGLLDGCGCGCRGDFELTEKGRAFLAEPA